MRIWIDIANTPHVLFFEPIIRELERRGHAVTVTARRFAGTLPLVAARGLRVLPIGAGHDVDRDARRKDEQFRRRTDALVDFARAADFDVAASHCSFTQGAAAERLSLPIFGTLDYEHTPLSAFRCSSRFMAPAVIPPSAFAAHGIPAAAIRPYDGLKEEVYLAGFRPDPTIRARLGVDVGERLVAFRPIAPHAMYADASGDHVQAMLLEHLARQPDVRVVILPRTEHQARDLAPLARRLPAIQLCAEPIDGPSLLSASDLVVCGGGTMLREAAVLGVPAVSIFPGALGAVDRWLLREGRVQLVRSAADVERLRVARRTPGPPRAVSDAVRAAIVQGICETAGA